jgi:hypothetical protein
MIARLFTGEHGRAVTLGAIGIGLLLLVQFVVLPLARSVSDSEKRLRSAHKALVRAERLAGEYVQLRSVALPDDDTGAGSEGTLFARMEAAGRRLKLDSMVESMRPENRTLPDGSRLQQVRVRLGGLGMRELLDYLYECETSVGGRVDSLSLRRNRDKLLDVDMVIARPEGS